MDFSHPGKPTNYAFIEIFNGKLRQEYPDTHWFMSFADAQKKMETWPGYYEEDRLHSAIGYNVPSSRIRPAGTFAPPV